jgi:hypothetical protein
MLRFSVGIGKRNADPAFGSPAEGVRIWLLDGPGWKVPRGNSGDERPEKASP